MFPRLLLLFTVIPAIEIYLLIEIGGLIGAGNTILTIIVTGLIGAHYARAQGVVVLNRLQRTLQEDRMPGSELIDGAMLLVGGALLVTPGFITDIVGFLLIFPPTRDLIKSVAVEYVQRKIDRGEIVLRRY